MALNYSSFSTFPAPVVNSDDDISPWDIENGYDYNGEYSDSEYAQSAFDPVVLLPDDPFGMELDCSMEAALASFFEANSDDFFGWTFMYSHEPEYYDWMEDSDYCMENFTEFSTDEIQDGTSSLSKGDTMVRNHGEEHCSGDDGLPHEALFFALRYLGVRDLLSVERVCKSFQSAVQNDALLWRCIHIDFPLGENMTNDILLHLTQRSQGSLQCLSLHGCSRITDDGLKQVLDVCPKLRRLGVNECVRVSLEGMIKNLKTFQPQAIPGIECLKLGRLHMASAEQYKQLKSLLGLHQIQKGQPHNPRFYHVTRTLSPCEDDCVLDIELCPICQNYKLVYDCPQESCQGKSSKQCRACTFCIARCVGCGKCIRDDRYVETFCFDFLCLECWDPSLVEESDEEADEFIDIRYLWND